MWHYHDGMGWWMIWRIVFLAVTITLIVWGVRKLAGHGNANSDVTSKRSPLEIAKERYAKGEISKEEFERIKKDIS